VVRIHEIDWNDAMVEHIARHGVLPEEVEDVVFGRPLIRRGKNRTYRFLGQTAGGRLLSVIVARRPDNFFAVVTARDGTDEERRAFRRR